MRNGWRAWPWREIALTLAVLGSWASVISSGHTGFLAGDGYGYFVYVRGLTLHGNFLHHDSDETPTESSPASQMTRAGFIEQSRAHDGRVYSQYPIGPSLLWLPGYSVVHASLKLLHSVGAGNLPPADGYSSPYRLSIA